MIRLKDDEFREIVEYVKKNYGINLNKKKVLIECRLGKELEKRQLRSFTQYLSLLYRDKTGKIEEDMISCLSTNYTYFCREYSHFEFFKNQILPEISRLQRPSVYSVWCAGCSSGEECYTLAMIFEDYKKKGNWVPALQISGTDISRKALERAREGVYPNKELEKIPEEWQRRYCRIRDDGYFEIDSEIKKYVKFAEHNLVSNLYREESFDLVICRNVMIYFDIEEKKKLIRKLVQSLKREGYLFIGHAELLRKDEISLEPAEPAIYRKSSR